MEFHELWNYNENRELRFVELLCSALMDKVIRAGASSY